MTLQTCIAKQYILELIFNVSFLFMMIISFNHKTVLLLITGIYFIIVVLYLLYQKRRFDNLSIWQKQNAKVLRTNVIKCLCFSAYNASERQSLQSNIYRPDITYTYLWKDQTYTSNQYARSLDDADCNFSYTLEEAKDIADKAKQKKEIDIYVNTQTGESAITLDVAQGYGIPYMGLAIAGLMILFLVYKVYTY